MDNGSDQSKLFTKFFLKISEFFKKSQKFILKE